VKAWPGQAGHARAVEGLDVLLAMGHPEALHGVHDVARFSTFAALRTEAEQRWAAEARRQGLADEELADRVVPSDVAALLQS